MKNTEKYNTQVRQAISDAYVECSKEKQSLIKEYTDISKRLVTEQDKISYKEYIKLKRDADFLQREIEDLSIRLDTWDKAREICLDLIK